MPCIVPFFVHIFVSPNNRYNNINMKKIVITIATSFLIATMSFASKNISLENEIKREIKNDIKKVKMNESNPDFAIVSFKIINNKIKVTNVNSSNYNLKKHIFTKLINIEIDSEYDLNKEYKYKFIFKK